MALSWIEAQEKVLAPGSGTPFELVDAEVRGVPMQVFKNTPPNLAAVLQNARNFGDAPFILYEGEKYSFAQTMDNVDGLCHVLVNKYGVKKGDRVAVAMRNFPEWIMAFAAIISVGAINVSFNAWWTEDEMDFALQDLVTSSASTLRTLHAARWVSRCCVFAPSASLAPMLTIGQKL
jgi:long-chain acyl-CoA synthetase